MVPVSYESLNLLFGMIVVESVVQSIEGDYNGSYEIVLWMHGVQTNNICT